MRINLTPYELFVRDNASGPPTLHAPEQHGKTIIRLQNATGELDRVTLSDDDASGTAIAEATVQLILRAGYLRDGDTIPVREED
jgi:hypothetical protein